MAVELPVYLLVEPEDLSPEQARKGVARLRAQIAELPAAPRVVAVPDAEGWWFALHAGHSYAIPYEITRDPSKGLVYNGHAPVATFPKGEWYGPLTLPEGWGR